jgi:hypothetical protein
MLKIFLKMCWALVEWLKYPIIFIFVLYAIFMLMCVIFTLIGFKQGKRFKKGSRQKVKKHGFLRQIFIDAPKQIVEDKFNQDPDFFTHQGLIIFEGRQGNGKSVAMVHEAMQLQEEFPLAKCTSNLAYTQEDMPLKDWRMLINFKNGIKGVIVLMDELQNWFSSNDSKNFPPEMLQVITQNRKNRRVILGTAQNFYLLSKAIRTQTTEVRRCITLLGCITIVRRFEPILDAQGDVLEWKNRGMYFFVHDKKLRESYDTYKVIERLQKVGFKEEQTETNIINKTYIVNSKK